MKVINKKFFLVFLFLLITLSFKSTWLVQNDSLGKPGNDDLSHWLHAATIAYDFDLNYEFDYEVDEKARNVLLTDSGIIKCEKMLNGQDLYDPADPWAPFILNATKAKELFIKDTHEAIEDYLSKLDPDTEALKRF